MQQIKQILQLLRSTPGTHLYEAADKTTAQIKSLYVQKSAFLGVAPPPKVVVTIDAA